MVKTLKAVFVRKTVTLTVNPPDGQGITTPVPGTYTFNEGDTFQVTATPAAGWTFGHWTFDDGTTSTDNPLKLTK